MLTGPLTSGERPLAALRYLSFDDNRLRGTLPSGLALMQLRHLSLSGNALSGPLPPGFSNLTALRLLDLGSNRLTGSFPSGMLLLPQMLTLVRRLGPEAPGSSRLTDWFTLQIAGNNLFAGSLPEKEMPAGEGLHLLHKGARLLTLLRTSHPQLLNLLCPSHP